MVNSAFISAVKAFLLAPGVKSQAQVNAFLDSCGKLLALARGANFGMSSRKYPDAGQVAVYYSNFFMPKLKIQLSLTMTPSQLNASAAHVVSLASAVSAELSSGKLSSEQQDKLNGLVTFLMKLVDVVCNKIDDRDMYYQFQSDYRLLVQVYLNPGFSAFNADKKSRDLEFFGRLFHFFSPKALHHDSAKSDVDSLHAEDSGTPRDGNTDADLDDKAGPKNGPYRYSF